MQSVRLSIPDTDCWPLGKKSNIPELYTSVMSCVYVHVCAHPVIQVGQLPTSVLITELADNLAPG